MGTRSHGEGVKQEITRGLETMHREHGPGAPVPSRNDIVITQVPAAFFCELESRGPLQQGGQEPKSIFYLRGPVTAGGRRGAEGK